MQLFYVYSSYLPPIDNTLLIHSSMSSYIVCSKPKIFIHLDLRRLNFELYSSQTNHAESFRFSTSDRSFLRRLFHNLDRACFLNLRQYIEDLVGLPEFTWLYLFSPGLPGFTYEYSGSPSFLK